MNSRTPSSRSRGSSRERSREGPSREERKEATRRAIIAAALKLLQDRSFSSLSLREVTREVVIVPAAFYRHFESMEALGLVLIDESFRTLRDTLRGARTGRLDPNRVIESSVETVIASITDRREHWRFIYRERSGGVTVLQPTSLVRTSGLCGRENWSRIRGGWLAAGAGGSSPCGH